MATQKDIAQFLSNNNNAQKLNDLVDDIHEAVMEYQVCTSNGLAFITSNVHLRLPYNRISITVPVR